MIRNVLFAIGLAAACCTSSSAAEKVVKANGSVNLTAAGGMMDVPPLDAVGLSITSDGTSIRFTATLKDAPGADAMAPVTVSMDTDNNPATGKKGLGGGPGGFEYLLEMSLCIQYEDHSTSCAGGSLKSKPAKRYGAADLKKYKDDIGNLDTVVSSLGFPGEKKAQQYPVDGKTVTVSIDYADIGAKSGQTIRLVTEKTGGRPQHGAPKFDDVLLTLK
jgi:hypothetical protein